MYVCMYVCMYVGLVYAIYVYIYVCIYGVLFLCIKNTHVWSLIQGCNVDTEKFVEKNDIKMKLLELLKEQLSQFEEA